MIHDTSFDKLIGDSVMKAHLERESKHKSSGKLSGSKMGWPLQWQLLAGIGVPQKPFDEYVLRFFVGVS